MRHARDTFSESNKQCGISDPELAEMANWLEQMIKLKILQLSSVKQADIVSLAICEIPIIFFWIRTRALCSLNTDYACNTLK